MDRRKQVAIVAILIVLVSVLGFGLWWVGTYNAFVREGEKIDSQWAQVQNQYQRKIDLIPTLVATVSEYQEFESSTLTNITALRSRWMNATASEEQVDLTNQLDAQLATIIVTYENYPELQSVTAVRDLMYELAGTENRIATERMYYNDYVRDFNTHIKSFPASMVAGSSGFDARAYYESANAPPAP
jgi:LemA protein